MTESSVLSKALDRLAFLHRHLPSHGTHGEEMFNAFDTVESALRHLAWEREELKTFVREVWEKVPMPRELRLKYHALSINAAGQDVKVKDATSVEASAGAAPLDASRPVPAAPSTRSESDGEETKEKR